MYLLFTGLVSIALSVAKAFKYKINYGMAEYDYPLRHEVDLWERNFSLENYTFFLLDFTSDFFNYILFLIINITIHLYMVTKLRKACLKKLAVFESKILKNTKKIQKREFSVNKAE